MTGTDVTTDKGKAIIQQIDANIERAHSLSAAGNAESLASLREETEGLISGLSGKGSIAIKKAKRDSMAAVPEPKPAEGAEGGTVAVAGDYDSIEGVSELVSMGAERIAEGVRLHIRTADLARDVAGIILDMWRRIPNKDGDPDIMGTSQAARNAASAMYKAAGEGFERTEDSEGALDKFQRAVQHQRSTVRSAYLMGLDGDSAEAEAERSKFARVLESKPADVSPAEFLAEHYGTSLKSHKEIERQRQTGELEAPRQRVETATKTLRKAVKAAKPEDFQALDDKEKAAARKELEELYNAVKAMITATL